MHVNPCIYFVSAYPSYPNYIWEENPKPNSSSVESKIVSVVSTLVLYLSADIHFVRAHLLPSDVEEDSLTGIESKGNYECSDEALANKTIFDPELNINGDFLGPSQYNRA